MYCRKCGTWCEDSAVFCTQCGEPMAEATSSRTEENNNETMNGNSYNANYNNGYQTNYGGGYGQVNTYAGFWKRFLAYFIDAIILSIVGGILIGILKVIHLSGAANVITFVLGWIYYAYMESSQYQGTIGKMALQLRVTDLSGNRITFAKATGRFFGKIISGLILCIGYMMAGWTEQKQALHDMMAGTLVINE